MLTKLKQCTIKYSNSWQKLFVVYKFVSKSAAWSHTPTLGKSEMCSILISYCEIKTRKLTKYFTWKSKVWSNLKTPRKLCLKIKLRFSIFDYFNKCVVLGWLPLFLKLQIVKNKRCNIGHHLLNNNCIKRIASWCIIII